MPKPLVKIRDHLEKDLIIKRSGIPKAGKGVFTKIDIPKHEVISEFTGEKISHTVGLARFMLKQTHSIIHLNKTYCIDSIKDKECISTYINDAKGITKVQSLNNNAFILNANGRIYVIAKRKIKAGEEILMSYGTAYWKAKKRYKI